MLWSEQLEARKSTHAFWYSIFMRLVLTPLQRQRLKRGWVYSAHTEPKRPLCPRTMRKQEKWGRCEGEYERGYRGGEVGSEEEIEEKGRQAEKMKEKKIRRERIKAKRWKK